jgi:hypothetical protein
MVGGHHAGHFCCVPVGQKAGVEANHNAGVATIFFTNIVGNSLGYQPQIAKSKSFADNGTPAVGAKFDGHCVSFCE